MQSEKVPDCVVLGLQPHMPEPDQAAVPDQIQSFPENQLFDGKLLEGCLHVIDPVVGEVHLLDALQISQTSELAVHDLIPGKVYLLELEVSSEEGRRNCRKLVSGAGELFEAGQRLEMGWVEVVDLVVREV